MHSSEEVGATSSQADPFNETEGTHKSVAWGYLSNTETNRTVQLTNGR